MDAALIAQLVDAAANVLVSGAQFYAAEQTVMAETDALKIHTALVKAQAATATLTAQVDAAVAAASQR